MNWKFTADQPVYQQIMSAVRGAILAGEWLPGDRIPSVRDLSAQASVNPNTMQRALTELEREGILVGAGTTGRMVTADPEILSDMKVRIQDELVREYAAKFAAIGLTPAQAAQLFLQMDVDKEVI